jgi:hypothetical protein
MDYVILYTFMFFYEAVEQHYQATASETEIHQSAGISTPPKQLAYITNEK